MKYKAIAFDLDGTLLGSDLKIRDDVANAIQTVRSVGITVLMATGRHHTAAIPYHHQLSLNTPLMCCNGTYAWDTHSGSALMARPLLKEQARQVLCLVRKYRVHILMYIDSIMTYETHEPHLMRLLRWAESVPVALRPAIFHVESFDAQIDTATFVWKFAATSPNLELLHKFSIAVEQELEVSCEWSGRDRVDIAQRGNSKGQLLTEWLKKEGIAPEHAIAFGDSPNDMSMLSAVGLGVAMGHSNDAVRAAADLVTGSNDSPAIASVLEQHVLSANRY